jgi:restriction endonuclease S subunit
LLAPEVAARVTSEAQLRAGDTLIACSAAGCLGRVAFYNSDGVTASVDTHIAIARPDTDKVLPLYLYRYLVGAQGQRQLRSRERGDWEREKVGFRLTELNLRDLQRVPVPVPSMVEQRAILTRLARADTWDRDVRRARAEQLDKAAKLLPAVLQTWFYGSRLAGG